MNLSELFTNFSQTSYEDILWACYKLFIRTSCKLAKSILETFEMNLLQIYVKLLTKFLQTFYKLKKNFPMNLIQTSYEVLWTLYPDASGCVGGWTRTLDHAIMRQVFCHCAATFSQQLQNWNHWKYDSFLFLSYRLIRTRHIENFKKDSFLKKIVRLTFWHLNQGSLTKGEGSVQLTSSLRQVVL